MPKKRGLKRQQKNEKDLQLIKLVKQHPLLYDPSVTNYINYNAREATWQKIGDILNYPASDCKTRWSNMRDVNRHIYKKINEKGTNRKYKYHKQLQFMLPFYKDLNVKLDDDSEMSDDGNAFEALSDADDINDYETSNGEESKFSTKTEDEQNTAKSRSSIKRKFNLEASKPDTDESVAAISHNEDTIVDKPIDTFLQSIASTLKTFTPYHLNVAKSKIFAVVQGIELEQIVAMEGNTDFEIKHVK